MEHHIVVQVHEVFEFRVDVLYFIYDLVVHVFQRSRVLIEVDDEVALANLVLLILFLSSELGGNRLVVSFWGGNPRLALVSLLEGLFLIRDLFIIGHELLSIFLLLFLVRGLLASLLLFLFLRETLLQEHLLSSFKHRCVIPPRGHLLVKSVTSHLHLLAGHLEVEEKGILRGENDLLHVLEVHEFLVVVIEGTVGIIAIHRAAWALFVVLGMIVHLYLVQAMILVCGLVFEGQIMGQDPSCGKVARVLLDQFFQQRTHLIVVFGLQFLQESFFLVEDLSGNVQRLSAFVAFEVVFVAVSGLVPGRVAGRVFAENGFEGE